MNAAEPDSANVVNAAEPDFATEPAMNASEPASASASEPAPAPKPALKRKEIAVESSSFIKALFPIVYELVSFIADQLKWEGTHNYFIVQEEGYPPHHCAEETGIIWITVHCIQYVH